MAVAPYVPGMPGVRAAQTSGYKVVFKGGKVPEFLPAGKVIDGDKSRDPTNSPVTTLQPGLLLGKVTSNSKYRPSIIGPTTVAYTSGGTSLTVGATTATELVRRVGTTGTFKLVGPAAAAGPIQSVTVTYSAVNTTSGVITITDAGATFISGSFVCPTDGSENMLTFIPDGSGITAVDGDGTGLDVQFPLVPVGGVVISSALINWPSDTSLQTYVVGKLNAAAGGKFEFDHVY